MFMILTCVWLLLLRSGGHVSVYALGEFKLCLPISAGLQAPSIMHEDQYAVALWVRLCNSVPISSIPGNCPAVWRDLCLWIYQGSWERRLQSGYLIYYYLEKKNTKLVLVFLVYLTFAVKCLFDDGEQHKKMKRCFFCTTLLSACALRWHQRFLR